jgi:hypothetical protein
VSETLGPYAKDGLVAGGAKTWVMDRLESVVTDRTAVAAMNDDVLASLTVHTPTGKEFFFCFPLLGYVLNTHV